MCLYVVRGFADRRVGVWPPANAVVLGPHGVIVDGIRWDGTRTPERVTQCDVRPGHLTSNGDDLLILLLEFSASFYYTLYLVCRRGLRVYTTVLAGLPDPTRPVPAVRVRVGSDGCLRGTGIPVLPVKKITKYASSTYYRW